MYSLTIIFLSQFPIFFLKLALRTYTKHSYEVQKPTVNLLTTAGEIPD